MDSFLKNWVKPSKNRLTDPVLELKQFGRSVFSHKISDRRLILHSAYQHDQDSVL